MRGTDTRLSRRAVASGLCGGLTGLALTSASLRAHAQTQAFDLDDPANSLNALVKLRGTRAGGRVFLWYKGTASAVLPGEAPVTLFGFQTVIRSDWVPKPDGAYQNNSVEIGCIADLATGQPIAEFANPVTGETVATMDIRDGPSQSLHSVHGSAWGGREPDPSRTLNLPWNLHGDELWLETITNSAFPNPLDQESFPEAWSGPTVFLQFKSTYRARLSDIANPRLDSAPMTATFDALMSWPPWLRMADRPGMIAMNYSATKFERLDQVPAVMREYATSMVADFFTAERPWPRPMSLWERYQRLHG